MGGSFSESPELLLPWRWSHLKSKDGDEAAGPRGNTGHAEVVRVIYRAEDISFEKLLKVFWENHDPTQALQ
ncbi:hypothetical protein NDU88_010758 [Pleurodeles waltl]|uniref:peptide-methionine (S)-S-oxide reductase n=1 Tax=Pleurodeles waltl TaxID=8319 RepID=A0AAV7S1R1_PLEWA|nr:hypothetical protein NDU88_010758 [Pleurodeles waltl]